MRIIQTVFGVFHQFDLARELEARGHLSRVFSNMAQGQAGAGGYSGFKDQDISLDPCSGVHDAEAWSTSTMALKTRPAISTLLHSMNIRPRNLPPV